MRAPVLLFTLAVVIASGIRDSGPQQPAPRPCAESPADDGWRAAALAQIAELEYHASRSSEGLQAPNRTHDIRIWFDTGSLRIGPRNDGDPSWSWAWQTSRWGRADNWRAAEAAEPEATGARVSYETPGLTEWYVNSPDGIEQGYTVHDRPAGTGPLRIEGSTHGGLRAVLAEEGMAIDLIDENDVCLLRYDKLVVRDAGGTELPAHLEMDGSTIAIVVADENASYPITVDPLLNTPTWTSNGDEGWAYHGGSVATAGDVNGDGFSDVLVAAYGHNGPYSDAGRVYLYMGTATGLASSAAWVGVGEQTSTYYGYSVSTAGDVNGDGFDDVIIGAELYDSAFANQGRAYVYLGSASGLSAAPAWTVDGEGFANLFGATVAWAGDVNGDGFDDVIVSAPGLTDGEDSEGRVYVFQGSATGLDTLPAWTVDGNQTSAFLGRGAVSTAGDVNGDGYDDVVIGSKNFNSGWTDNGAAWVYHGSATGLETTAAWMQTGGFTQDYYGASVSTAGDVNADGRADVIVGAPGYDTTKTDAGIAYIYYGSSGGLGTAPSTMPGSTAGDELGTTVSTAGDVSGDGFADIVIGAPGASSGSGKLWGSYGGVFGVGSLNWAYVGTQGGASLGAALATAGDVNGDGFSDIVVGAPYFDDTPTDNGRAYVFMGTNGNLSTPLSPVLVEQNQTQAQFGASVAMVGDVNGDGYSDMIVGAPDFDGGQPGEGAAIVFLGRASPLTPLPAWIKEGNQASAAYGSSVAGAGDVNGDGYSDVIVGAPDFDSGQADEGAVFVYLGSASGPGPVAWFQEGNQAGASFGGSVAGAGDVNGDGYGDVVVGAPNYDAGQSDEGKAFVYLGSPSGLEVSAAWTAEGSEVSANFGWSVSTAGDVNRDACSDVIIGAPLYDGGATDAGAAFAYLGSASGLEASASWTVQGNQSSEHFGWSVAAAGDVNANGYSDVIVGAPLYDGGATDAGAAFAYLGSASGLGTSASWSSQSNQASAHFGWSVASAGDVNGDGRSDVVIGAPLYDGGETDEGRVYVYLGCDTGFFPPPGLCLTPFWTTEEDQASAHLGWSVCTGGDLNGDGFSDLVIGAPLYDNGETDEGIPFIYFGNTLFNSPPRIPRQLRSDGSAPIALLGLSDSYNSFRLRARGRSAAGRAHVRLQAEVKPIGVSFTGTGLLTGPVTDTGIGIELEQFVGGLDPSTAYHWRLRVVSDTPLFPRTPWMSPQGNGAAEWDLRTASLPVGVNEPPRFDPRSPTLAPPAPNPFGSTTRLAFDLTVGARVRLTIYDVSGRRVAVLTDAYLGAGPHAVGWDGRNYSGEKVSSGVYFARLSAGGRLVTRRLVLIR